MMKALTKVAALGLLALLASCGGKGTGNEAAANDTATTAMATNGMGTTTGNMSNMAMPAAAKRARGTGTIKAVDRAAGTITLDHGPIPEANWPAMTMTFKAVPGVIASAKEGEKVSFDVALANGSGEVIAVRKQ